MANQSLGKRMARYVLGIGKVIKDLDGKETLEKRVRAAADVLANNKADDLGATAHDERHRKLAERLRRMLRDFGAKNIQISADNDRTQKVDNPKCPCLHPFVSQAEQFGFKPEEVHRLACMICMPNYAKGARLAGVEFRGKLTLNGCWMSFSRRK